MSRKYAQDYRLDHVLRPSGRLKTVAVYDGPRFTFTASDARLAQARVWVPLLTGLCSLLTFYLLWFSPDVKNVWYAILPACFSVVSLAFVWASVFRFLTAKPPVTRECRDRSGRRFGPACLITAILHGLCAVGSTVYLFLNAAFGLSQILYALAAALGCAAALTLFLRRGVLAMRQLEASGEDASAGEAAPLPEAPDAAPPEH